MCLVFQYWARQSPTEPTKQVAALVCMRAAFRRPRRGLLCGRACALRAAETRRAQRHLAIGRFCLWPIGALLCVWRAASTGRRVARLLRMRRATRPPRRASDRSARRDAPANPQQQTQSPVAGYLSHPIDTLFREPSFSRRKKIFLVRRLELKVAPEILRAPKQLDSRGEVCDKCFITQEEGAG